jgi:general secretion pathway protein F
MSAYRYKAKKGPEDIIDGVIEASSEKEAIEKISAMGFVPVSLNEERHAETPEALPAQSRGRVRQREITVTSRQLASLLKSGVPILASIRIIAQQTENRYLKFILEAVSAQVKEGAVFSESLSQFPKVFSPFFRAMVHSGEESGSLPQVLFRVAEYRRSQEEMLSRFRMAMAYPILMAVVGCATVIFMFTFVMPRLTGLFSSMGQALPAPTRVLIAVSSGIKAGWLPVVIFLVFLVLILRSKAVNSRASFGLLVMRLPLVGPIIVKMEISRFCRSLELLLKNGIPILKALEIATPIIANAALREQLKESWRQLEQGGSFGASLKESRIFPAFMSNLIIVGEESGKLDEALAEVAGVYERDTDEAIRVASNLLEPLMILALGLVLGFIVVAMMLPIFEMNLMPQ